MDIHGQKCPRSHLRGSFPSSSFPNGVTEFTRQIGGGGFPDECTSTKCGWLRVDGWLFFITGEEQNREIPQSQQGADCQCVSSTIVNYSHKNRESFTDRLDMRDYPRSDFVQVSWIFARFPLPTMSPMIA